MKWGASTFILGVAAVASALSGGRCIGEQPAATPVVASEEAPANRSGLEALDEGAADAVALRAALERYFREIEAIDLEAARRKEEARARLLGSLEAAPRAASNETFPGLVGGATVNGAASRFVFEYAEGALFDRQLVWDRFHDGDAGPFPGVAITLQGYVVVPRDMTVFIRQAGGGVNEDWAELFIDERSIGIVGDDTAKKSVYVVALPQGTHRVRWVLTAGTFQHCLLKFEDPQTGELLPLHHTAADRAACGYSDAREVVPVNGDAAAWPLIESPSEWQWTPVGAGL